MKKHHSGALQAVLAENSRLNDLPGEKYSYSNINYWLLGSVIEAVSGEGYAAYVRKNIFQRVHLSMDEIDFTYSDTVPHAKGWWRGVYRRLITEAEG